MINTTRYNIDTCSMLVEFMTSVWTARKLDKSSTDELVQRKNAASKDAARVNKHLLAGRTELDGIIKHIGTLRNQYFYPKTLPWTDNGLRLLPTVSFMEFNQRMVDEEGIFWDLVNDFVAVYPSLITAQAMALGDMFDRADFPTPEDVRTKFAFHVNYIPVPTSGDFRVDIGNAAAQELKDKFEEFSATRVDAAMADVRKRLKEHLQRMSDRLTVDVVGGEARARVFHDSLLDTGLELCDSVKSLNLVGDQDLEAARKHLEKTITGLGAADLRKDVSVRTDVKKQVDSILSSMTW